MKFFLTILVVLSSLHIHSQITVGSETLPDIGDILEYTVFANYEDTISYKTVGEDMEWTFNDFVAVNTQIESYADISTSSLTDSFPEANMIVEFGGFESAAVRTDSSVAIVGLVIDDFTGFGVETNVVLKEGFRLRSTPFEFGDLIEDSFSAVVNIDASIIPGLDSLDLGFPGATLDSIRVTTDISKREISTGWGTVSILGNDIEALQIIQEDNTNTTIELGILFFGNRIWLDAAAVLGDMVDGFGGNQSSTTFKYVSADDKRSIVEFTENRVVIDTLGTTMLEVNGRTSAEFLSSTIELTQNQNAFTIYPNPSSDFIQITSEDNEDIKYVNIYDVNGKLQNRITDLQNSKEIPIQHLQEGMYFLHLKTDNLETVKKFKVSK